MSEQLNFKQVPFDTMYYNNLTKQGGQVLIECDPNRTVLKIIESCITKNNTVLSNAELAQWIFRYYIARTKNHVGMVQVCAAYLKEFFTFGGYFERFMAKVQQHDYDKFSGNEHVASYAMNAPLYKYPNLYDISPEAKRIYEEIEWPKHHQLHDHHPEHYMRCVDEENNAWMITDDEMEKFFKDKGGHPTALMALGEMVADWMAVGVEMSNTAKSWWLKNKDTHWSYGPRYTQALEACLAFAPEQLFIDQIEPIPAPPKLKTAYSSESSHVVIRKESDINSVADLKEFFSHCKYGIVDTSTGSLRGKTHTHTTEKDYYNHWKLLSPDETIKHKCGVCYDTVLVSKSVFDRLGIKYKLYFAYSNQDEKGNPTYTHTFAIYQDGDTWRWIEGSWGQFKKNDFSSSNSDELVSRIGKELANAHGVPQQILVLNSYPRPGVTMKEFHHTILKGSKWGLVDPDNSSQSRVSLEQYEPPYNEEQLREHGYSEEIIERLKNDPAHSWRMETGIELVHREPTRTELKRVWKNWQQMTPDQKRISDRKCRELFGCDNKTLYEYLIPQYKVESPDKGVVQYPPKSDGLSLEAISADTKTKIKKITFPSEEIDTLKKQDRIVTTRVSADYNKFFVDDLVRTPWGDIFKVTKREEISDVKDHPYFNELTEGQKKFLSKYSKIAVLTLMKTKVQDALSFSSESQLSVEQLGSSMESNADNGRLRLYHLSYGQPVASKMLTPRIPDNEFVEWGVEDGTTKRICFSTSISKATLALGRCKEGQELHVYEVDPSSVDQAILMKHIVTPSKDQVPDVGITKEVWCTIPVKVKYTKTIKLTSIKHEYTLKFKRKDGTEYVGHPREWNYDVVSAVDPRSESQPSTEQLDSSMEASTTPSKIAQKKKKILDFICKLCDTMEPSGLNSKRYRQIIGQMNDKEFDQFMNYMKEGKWQLHIVAPNMIVNLQNEDLLKACDLIGLDLFQRVWMYDKATGRKFLTDNKYMFVKLPIRRQQQFLDEKISVPDNDRTIDGLTGQVTGDSRSCSITNPEIQILAARGLNNTLQELVNIRGGNIHGYNEFRRMLEENGEGDLDMLDTGSRTRASVVGGKLLQSMMLDTNL